MQRARLLTAASPHGLLESTTEAICDADPAQGWCVVVPRSHLLRDVNRLLLSRCPESAWIGFRSMTLEALLAHYARELDPQVALTPLQVRQVVACSVREVHEQSGGEAFRGQVVEGRVSEATLRSLTRLFSELEPLRLGPADLARRLLEGPVSESISRRARDVVEVYRRYQGRLAQHRYEGPRSRDLEAAELARNVEPPDGVRRFLFLGLDGSGLMDPGMRLVHALRRHPSVEEVRLVLVLPPLPSSPTWGVHGNTAIYEQWVEEVGGRERLPEQPRLDALPADLRAVVEDPFSYGEPPAQATGAVRGVQLPDLQTEAEWVAADIKRAVLAGEVSPDEVAVVARDMEVRAEALEPVFEALGLPIVSSREERACDVPAVRALLALFRLPAYRWRTSDVVAVAESPYLPLGLHPTLLARVGAVGTLPVGAEDWGARIQSLSTVGERQERHAPGSLPSTLEAAAQELGGTFSRFVEELDHLLGPESERTPSRWVEALLKVVGHWRLEEQIYGAPAEVAMTERARLARTDLDGVNALLRAMHDWLRGREIAGLTDTLMDSAAWYGELEVVAQETRLRASTYPLSAVQLLTPSQAALRQWKRVYLIGLIDGVFPARSEPSEHTLTEEERRALRLPTSEERSARERLLFHLAAAAAEERLTLTYPGLDDRGGVLVPSPFLTCMRLRVEGFHIETVRARTLVPEEIADVLSPVQVDWLAAQACLRLIDAAEGGAETIASILQEDPLVGAWLSRPGSRRAAEAWAVEHVREEPEGAGAGPLSALSSFAGQVPSSLLPDSLRAEDASFSPSELDQFGQCRYRFFASRALGLRAGRSEEDEDFNEAGAFGTLQHRILELLYRELLADRALPPTTHGQIEHALECLDRIAAEAVRDYAVSTHAQLWALDLDFVLDVLRRFVRRDLERMRAAHLDPCSLRVRTRLLALEERIGRVRPVEVEHEGVRFRLHGTIDRVEEVDDVRLSAKLQGWLVLRDYKSSRDAGPRDQLAPFLDGRSLQLPLYSIMAEHHFGGTRVYGLGELKLSLGSDPELLSAGQLNLRSGVPVLERHSLASAEQTNLIVAAQDTARHIAADRVREIRAGRFTPPPTRKCWGCHLDEVCRLSLTPNPARGRERAKMPLSVPPEALDASSSSPI